MERNRKGEGGKERREREAERVAGEREVEVTSSEEGCGETECDQAVGGRRSTSLGQGLSFKGTG